MNRKPFLVVGLVLVVAFSGCIGGLSGNGDGDGSGSQDASQVKQNAIDAIEDVETYRAKVTIQSKNKANNVERTVNTTSTVLGDRNARELKVEQTANAGERTVETKRYIVDQTLYAKNPAYQQMYSSKWIKSDLSENFSENWNAFDTIKRQEVLLDVSDVEILGEEEVNGEETYVVKASPGESEYAEIQKRQSEILTGNRPELTVNSISSKYWISKDSNRPVKAEIDINITTQAMGQEIIQEQEISILFESYNTDVSINLPKKAREGAVDPSQQSG